MFELPSETGQDVRTSVIRAMILYKIQRQITCNISGRVLDVDTCVAITGGPDGDDVIAVIDPQVWAETSESRRKSIITADRALWIGRVEQTA